MAGRSGAARMGAARSAGQVLRSPWPALLLVVLLLVGLAVVVAAAGPARFGEPRLDALVGLEPPFSSSSGEGSTGEAADASAEEEPAGLPGWMTVVWLLGVAALLVLVVRWVLRLLQADDWRGDQADEDAAPEGLAELHLLEAVRRGVQEAGEVLAATAPSESEQDAVIRCWLALENAASGAGIPRTPSQTPTEFVAALLHAQHADPVATSDLLHLYHRARFGAAPLPAGAITRARYALDRIAASLPDAGMRHA